MSGKLKHLVERGEGFWARVVVPAKLRAIIGKTELREPLGSSRREAERKLHAALARFYDQLAAARRQFDQQNVARVGEHPARRSTLSAGAIARTHYAEELELDDVERNHPARDDISDMGWSRPDYVERLRAVASGRASNKETAATIGWAIGKFTARGNVSVEANTAPWRDLARTLAGLPRDPPAGQ